MSTVQRLAKNSIALLLGNIASTLIAILASVYLARYLKSEGLGKYSIIFAYLSLFSFLTTFGVYDILVREISRDNAQADRLLGNALALTTSLSVGAIVISWVILFFLGFLFNLRMLIYIASLNMLFAPYSLYTTILQINLQQKYQVAVEVGSRIILSILTFVLILIKATLVYFVILNLLVAIFVALGYRYFCSRFLKPKWRVDLKIWLYLLRQSWPLALTYVFIGIYNRIDQVMLFQMQGQAVLGIYSAAVRLTEHFTIIPVAFASSVLPFLARYFVEEKDYFKYTYTLSFRYLISFIVPVALITTLVSKQITHFIYGQHFIPSSSALAVLIWSELFVFTGIVHHHILISIGKQHLDFIFTLSSAITNVILNLILIPPYGAQGAALATVVSLGVFWPISYILPVTRPYALCIFRSTIKPLVASLSAGILFYLLFSKTLFVGVMFFPVIYIVILFIIGGVKKEDFKILLKALTITPAE